MTLIKHQLIYQWWLVHGPGTLALLMSPLLRGAWWDESKGVSKHVLHIHILIPSDCKFFLKTTSVIPHVYTWPSKPWNGLVHWLSCFFVFHNDVNTFIAETWHFSLLSIILFQIECAEAQRLCNCPNTYSLHCSSACSWKKTQQMVLVRGEKLSLDKMTKLKAICFINCFTNRNEWAHFVLSKDNSMFELFFLKPPSVSFLFFNSYQDSD